ncbi:MAG: hypothetical protein JHC95_02470, partial [Solirubrobacteraceae bacterium]|nr:hypothetical protein [Solirubrobacteraceae bacterium]
FLNQRLRRHMFVPPEPLIQKASARVMSLTDGTSKMSKSDANDASRINLLDQPAVIAKKIKSANTDAIAGLTLDPARPDLRLDHAALLAWLGREDAAVGEFGRALDAMPPADAVGRAEAWVVRGDWYRSSLCVPHLALRAFREARTELHAAPDAPIEVRVHALAGAAWAEALSGDLDEVDRLLDEICSIAGPLAERDEVVHELGHARSTALIRRGRFVESYAPALEAADAALRVGRLDMAYGALGNAACAAACAGDLPRALAFTERIELASRDVAPPIHAEVLATRAILLARMGRHDEARAEIAREREVVSGLEDPVASATAAFDEGVVALAAGEDEAAAELFDHALRGHAKCSRAAARLSRAEALARLDRLDEAEQELRATALEPMSPSDQPDTLVPRLTRLQGLVAEHRGDHDLAVRRLREAVDGWRRVAADRDGERYTALLADVGRLPLGGLVMPARELERVEQELHALEPAVNT